MALTVCDARAERGEVVQRVALSRLEAAKRAFTTRRASWPHSPMLVSGSATPRVGDLVLARVTALGHHTKLELPNGRRATLHPGDDVVVAYGNRYAADQFHAKVPETLEACHLVASGGVAAMVDARSDRARRPTRITPYGLIAHENGDVLRLADFAIQASDRLAAQRPRVVAVLGSAMNAGKTTAVSALTFALARAGRKVGVAKATGTGSGGDLWSAIDAGARTALDFTDAGLPSTYGLSSGEIERTLELLVAHLVAEGHDAVIVEIADGLLHRENADLVTSATFRRLIDDVVFAAADPMCALAGEKWLSERGRRPRLLTGQFTRSPLALEEVARNTTTTVLGASDLRSGVWMPEDAAPHHLPAVG